MHFRAFLGLSVASLPLAITLSTPAFAQETTSAISGQVTDEAGAIVPGAKVVVRHIPSGTINTTTTDGTGTYSLRGLRVGGPYTVTVTVAGHPAEQIDDVALLIGETLNLPVAFTHNQIVVTGTAVRGSRALATSSQSTFNAADIANVVSARRDVRDIMRRDLLSSFNPSTGVGGGVSIAGGNIRTQRFSVDGVQIQDSFGLNYGGLPSSRGIISLEMIDQLTVKAAPFDISEGNFQGGAVNVVLKSGTNHFHASGFGNFGSAGLTGKRTRDNRGVVGDVYPVGNTPILDFRNYGGSISGPIIKDKVFFSVSYEKLTEGTPNFFGVQGGSAPNIVPNLFYADTAVPAGTQIPPLNATDAYSTGAFTLPGLNTVFKLFNTSGYAPFAIGDVPTAIAERDEKYAAKLDWNIAPGQRFSATFIHHQNVIPSFSSPTTGGNTNPTAPNILLQSDLYQLSEFTNAGSAQLNSQWTDKFSTELRVSHKFYRRGQDAYSGPDYAQFNVCLDPTSIGTAGTTGATLCSAGSPVVKLGPDTPRQANKFNSKSTTYQANATLRAGDHTFKVEYDLMSSKLYNLFVFGGGGIAGSGGPQGLYYFDSTADFGNRAANELVLTSTTVGDKNNGFVNWGYNVHTVGAQDTWKATSRLTFNGGIRYDLWETSDHIIVNPNFQNRYSVLYPGLTNNATLNGRTKLQPRLGFNWAPTDTIKVVGGVGLFAGGFSDVFISNNYSNSGGAINSTGAAITSIDIVRNTTADGCVDRSTGKSPGAAVCAAALNGVSGASIPTVVTQYLQGNTGVLANTLTNSLDPKFKIPAQWKYNLSLNWKPDFTTIGLGTGWTFRADALFSDAQSAVRWIDLRAQPLVVGGVVQLAPDGRPRYGGALVTANGTLQPGSNYDIQLTNTDRGQSRVFAIGVQKRFSFVDVSAGYTHQNVKDVGGVLVSSTVSSSYSLPTSDPNSGGDYGRSAFEVTHTIRGTADFHHKFFGDNETRLGVNFEHRSGQPYSAQMFDNTNSVVSGRSSVFGTALNTQSHLLYVPNFALTPSTTASTTQGVAGGLTQYGNVIFADAPTLASVQALVNSTVLGRYQGQIAPKNVLTGPSYDKMDLNFAQEVTVYHGLKVSALFSIENFLNLLNRDWGSYQDFSNFTSTGVIRVSCQTPAAGSAQTCPAYVYSVYNAPKSTSYPKSSLYTIRAGVRVSF